MVNSKWELLERVGLIFTILGFAVLGYFGLTQFSQSKEMLQRLSAVEERLDSVIKNNPLTAKNPQQITCDANCVRQLVSEAVASISGITKPQKQEVVERVVEKVTTAGAQSSPKTQYIPLGGGQTTNTDWSDISGAEVTFNIKDFGTVTAVYFEAQLKSPAGLVYARLWDKTANTIVSDSEISNIAGDAKLVSSKVTVPTGGRTLIVQLRSETQQSVQVASSRLRIDTK